MTGKSLNYEAADRSYPAKYKLGSKKLIRIDNMLDEVKVNHMYTNKKNKRTYYVVSIGFHTELEELTVHYKPMYKGAHYTDFYRPLELFKEKFEE